MRHLPVITGDGEAIFEFEAVNVKNIFIEGSFVLTNVKLELDDDIIDIKWSDIDLVVYTFQPGKYSFLEKLTKGPLMKYPITIVDEKAIVRQYNDIHDCFKDTEIRLLKAKKIRLSFKCSDPNVVVWTLQ